MGESEDCDPCARTAAERDLFLHLLEAGECQDVREFLKRALTYIVDLLGIRRAYVELYDDEGDEPKWWVSHELSDTAVDDVRAVISKGIVAATLAAGQPVVTASALLDARFSQRHSVQAKQIEAVLCVPLSDGATRGVLYLEGRSSPGLFAEADQTLASVFARRIAPLARRILFEERTTMRSDPTRELRASLKLDQVIGRSGAIVSVLRQIALVAPLNVTVLLTGESGTGKSLLARVIHDNSPRAAKPFVDLNCATLPEALLESELFGALPGAHSTASRRIDGKVAAAEGGTLFLDEIALLSPASQAKLLQLLQSKLYYPLGSSTPVRANVRLIAATNLDLERAVAERQFREDLYYRINVLPLAMPSLSQRREDLNELADHLLREASERNGLPLLTLSENARRALAAAPWPGNIRQLSNVLEAGLIRGASTGVAWLEPALLFPQAPSTAGASESSDASTFQEATRKFQKDLVLRALRANQWNVVETARHLDVARSYLYTLIRTFELEREA